MDYGDLETSSLGQGRPIWEVDPLYKMFKQALRGAQTILGTLSSCQVRVDSGDRLCPQAAQELEQRLLFGIEMLRMMSGGETAGPLPVPNPGKRQRAERRREKRETQPAAGQTKDEATGGKGQETKAPPVNTATDPPVDSAVDPPVDTSVKGSANEAAKGSANEATNESASPPADTSADQGVIPKAVRDLLNQQNADSSGTATSASNPSGSESTKRNLADGPSAASIEMAKALGLEMLTELGLDIIEFDDTDYTALPGFKEAADFVRNIDPSKVDNPHLYPQIWFDRAKERREREQQEREQQEREQREHGQATAQVITIQVNAPAPSGEPTSTELQTDPPPDGKPPNGSNPPPAPPSGSPPPPPISGGGAAPPAAAASAAKSQVTQQPEPPAKPKAQPEPPPPKPSAAPTPAPTPVPTKKPPIQRTDNGLVYVPPPIPKIPLPVPLPAEFFQTIHSSPLANTAAIAGALELPPQLGLLGHAVFPTQDLPISINYNGCFAMGLFGVPGYGKSYAKGSIIEGALYQIDAANILKKPLCSVVFHHHPRASFPADLLDSIWPNSEPNEVKRLLLQAHARPAGFPDILVLTVPEQVASMRRDHPHCQIHGIRFSLAELGFSGLRILFGIEAGNQSLYMKQVQDMLLKLVNKIGTNVRLRDLERAIEHYPFDPTVRPRIDQRMEMARTWIADDRCMRKYIKPGRLILVDIRDEWIGTDMAMTLFSLVNQCLCLHADQKADEACNLLVVFDEAHKFAKIPEIRAQLGTLVRERRHLHASIILASQDPDSLPPDLLPILDMLGVFHHESASWNATLAEACHPFKQINTKMTSLLKEGQMFFWAREWYKIQHSLPNLSLLPLLVKVRARASQHGGSTRKAVR